MALPGLHVGLVTMALSALLAPVHVTSQDAGSPSPFRCDLSWNSTSATVSSGVARRLTLQRDNWNSHHLLTGAAKILLEEILGLIVEIIDEEGGQSVYANVASGQVDANLEVWTGNKDRSLACASMCGTADSGTENAGCAVEKRHDFLGHVGTFVSFRNTSVLESDLIEFWRSFRRIETLQKMPGANFSEETGLQRHICVRQHCSPDGRHYPARCGGDGLGQGTAGDMSTALSRGCHAYFGMHENWQAQFEQSIDALNLPLVTTFTGSASNTMREYLHVAHQTYDVVLFYHWKPSILLSGEGFAELLLPQDKRYCTQKWGSQLCDIVSKEIVRLVSPTLRVRLPDAASLLDSFKLNISHVDALLRKHPDNPTSTLNTSDEAACEWLKEHTDLWQPWIQRAIEQRQRTQNVSVGLLFDIGLNAGDTDESDLLMAVEIAIAHINDNRYVLPSIALQAFPIDMGRFRVLNSDSRSSRQQAFVADEVRDINRQLTAEGVVGVVGAAWSSDVKALSKAVSHPIFSPGATAEVLSNTSQYPRFARTIVPDSEQSAALADVIRFFQWSRVVLLHCDDVYCVGLADGVERALHEYGIPVFLKAQMGTKQLIQEGDADGTIAYIQNQLLSNCTDAGDQAAVVVLIVHEAEELMRAASEQRLQATILGSETLGSQCVPGKCGEFSLNSGALALRPGGVDKTHAKYEQLASEMGATNNTVQNYFVLTAYDAVWSLAFAIEAAVIAGDSIHNGSALLGYVGGVDFEGASGDVLFVCL